MLTPAHNQAVRSCSKQICRSQDLPESKCHLTGISVGHSKQRKTKAGPKKNWEYGDALLLRSPAEATCASLSHLSEVESGGRRIPPVNEPPAFAETGNMLQNWPEQHRCNSHQHEPAATTESSPAQTQLPGSRRHARGTRAKVWQGKAGWGTANAASNSPAARF